MTALTGTLYLDRAVLSEVVANSNTSKRFVVSGTSGVGGGAKSEEIMQDGEFRKYGNGNVRLILGSAKTQTQNLALRALRPSQLEVVKALQGRTVCYRDTYGRRVFGAFLELEIAAIPHSGLSLDDTLLYDVALRIQTVSYDEAV